MKVILWFIQANINPNKKKWKKMYYREEKSLVCINSSEPFSARQLAQLTLKCVTSPLVVLPSKDGNGLVLTAILACTQVTRFAMLRTDVPVSRILFHQPIFLSHHFWVNTHLRQKKEFPPGKNPGEIKLLLGGQPIIIPKHSMLPRSVWKVLEHKKNQGSCRCKL